MMYKLCFVVPVFNHQGFVEKTIGKLSGYAYPIFLIDDGSGDDCKKIMDDIVAKNQNVSLIRLPYNQGQGAAVMAGIRAAFFAGFTHALQIDVDGQHDVGDIDKFIALSKVQPEALISGKPVYDATIPKARLYGRYLTHFWVWIETLSFDIQDSMCGFRIYPLRETIQLLDQACIGRRMDFDVEIMVRLYWQGVPVQFIKTSVIYPPDGVSHFDSVADNWRITKMHTKLFFGMILRLFPLLRLKWSRE